MARVTMSQSPVAPPVLRELATASLLLGQPPTNPHTLVIIISHIINLHRTCVQVLLVQRPTIQTPSGSHYYIVLRRVLMRQHGPSPAAASIYVLRKPMAAEQQQPHATVPAGPQPRFRSEHSRDFARNVDFAPLVFEKCRSDPVRLRTSCTLLPGLRNIQATCSLLSVLE